MIAFLYRWGVIVFFSLLVSLSFTMYGLVFQQVGSPPTDAGLPAGVEYFVRLMFEPLFVLGLGLAFGGALVRMFMFDALGIAETALAGQMTIVMTVVFSITLLGDSMNVEDIAGMGLILLGVYLVQAEGTLL